MHRKLYQAIASRLDAITRCTAEWQAKHTDAIEALVREHMPHGSGFDNGTHLDFERSKPDRLVFSTGFHHMNDAGYYDGWTDHDVIVTPSLALEFRLRITGQDRNSIKDYIGETFHHCVSKQVEG